MTKRPRILLSVFSYGWAFDNIACQLKKALPYEFEIGIAQDHVPKSEYDLAVVFYWDQIDRVLSKVSAKKSIATIYDHSSWNNTNLARSVRSMNRTTAVVAGNPKIKEELLRAGVTRPVFVCPDGVDTDLFTPLPFPEEFTIGWCGSEHVRDGDFKGIGLIRRASEVAGVKLVEQEFQNRIPQDKMPEKFYSKISAYACASVSEGTPNPVLEALACGRPVITTRVGITEGLIRNGTGIFVDRDVDDIVRAIKEVQAWNYQECSKLCREAAEGKTWKKAAQEWATAIEKTLQESSVAVRAVPVDEFQVFDSGTGYRKAFQECKARHLVWIQEGPIPKDGRVEALVEDLKRRPSGVVCLKKGTIRVYRHSASRIVDTGDSEKEHDKRLFAIGHKVVDLDAGPSISQMSSRSDDCFPDRILPGKHLLERFESKGDVTAFVISTVEPSVKRCSRALSFQTYGVSQVPIHNVSPMNVAFQKMLDDCKTTYYMQVDADMILQPWAAKYLRDMLESNPNAAMAVGWLWGDAEERPIQGIKMYRHSIMKNFPYKSVFSCEVPQLEEVKAAGYKILVQGEPSRKEDCLGLHWALQTPEMSFRRWKRLMQKHRRYAWMGWLYEYPAKLLKKVTELPAGDPARSCWEAAFFGAISGLSGELGPDVEIDFNLPDPDYRRIATVLGEFYQGPKELIVYLTDRCNFQCNFCLRQHDGISKTGEVTPEAVLDAISKLPTIRSCCIAGFGEPLLYSRLYEMIDAVSSRGISIGLITNGMLLEDKIFELNTLPITYISVSLNAWDADSHYEMCHTKTWDRVLAGIKKASASDIRTGVSFVVTRRNIIRIPEMIEVARNNGAKFIHLLNLLPHAGATSLDFLDNVLSDRHPEDLALLDTFRNLPGSELVEHWPQPLTDTNPRNCLSPFVSIGIDGGGNVSGCRRVAPPEISNGKLGRWPWHGTYMRDLRLSIAGDRPAPEPCKHCFGNWRG